MHLRGSRGPDFLIGPAATNLVGPLLGILLQFLTWARPEMKCLLEILPKIPLLTPITCNLYKHQI